MPKRTLQGVVVSDKVNKTRKVQYQVVENVMEECVKKVPYQVCKMVAEEVTRQVCVQVCEKFACT